MGCIVCATRGGEDSRRTQERAIELARARGDDLVFLFVADTSFTPPAQQALAEIIADELVRLGRRLLGIAQVRAQEQGVVAQAIVRRGPVRSTLLSVLSELRATTLVMGAPHPHNVGARTLSPDEAHDLTEDVRVLGIEVIVVA